MKNKLHFKRAITNKSTVIIAFVLLFTLVIAQLGSELFNRNSVLTSSGFKFSYWNSQVITPETSTYSMGDVMRNALFPESPKTWDLAYNGVNQTISSITQSSFGLNTFLNQLNYTNWASINENIASISTMGYTLKKPRSSKKKDCFVGTLKSENINTYVSTTNYERFFLKFATMSNGVTRTLLAAFAPNTTIYFDHGYDGILAFSGSTDAWFTLPPGSYNSDRPLIIQAPGAFNVDKVLPLKVEIDVTGDYGFAADQVLNFDPSQAIYLYDNINNTYYNLRQGYVILNLQSGIHNEFSIVFKQPNTSILGVNELREEENMFTVYTNYNELVINNKGTQVIENVTMYNMLGQTVQTWKNKEGSATLETRISLKNVNSGSYLYHIQLDNGIIIKNKFIMEQK